MELKAAVSKCGNPGEPPLFPRLAGMLSSTGMRELPCVSLCPETEQQIVSLVPSLPVFVGYL